MVTLDDEMVAGLVNRHPILFGPTRIGLVPQGEPSFLVRRGLGSARRATSIGSGGNRTR
jgi:hypothetical protein